MASLHRGWLLVCTMLRRQRLLGCTRPHTLECARREFDVPRLLVTTGTSSHRSQEGDTGKGAGSSCPSHPPKL